MQKVCVIHCHCVMFTIINATTLTSVLIVQNCQAIKRSKKVYHPSILNFLLLLIAFRFVCNKCG